MCFLQCGSSSISNSTSHHVYVTSPTTNMPGGEKLAAQGGTGPSMVGGTVDGTWEGSLGRARGMDHPMAQDRACMALRGYGKGCMLGVQGPAMAACWGLMHPPCTVPTSALGRWLLCIPRVPSCCSSWVSRSDAAFHHPLRSHGIQGWGFFTTDATTRSMHAQHGLTDAPRSPFYIASVSSPSSPHQCPIRSTLVTFGCPCSPCWLGQVSWPGLSPPHTTRGCWAEGTAPWPGSNCALYVQAVRTSSTGAASHLRPAYPMTLTSSIPIGN